MVPQGGSKRPWWPKTQGRSWPSQSRREVGYRQTLRGSITPSHLPPWGVGGYVKHHAASERWSALLWCRNGKRHLRRGGGGPPDPEVSTTRWPRTTEGAEEAAVERAWEVGKGARCRCTQWRHKDGEEGRRLDQCAHRVYHIARDKDNKGQRGSPRGDLPQTPWAMNLGGTSGVRAETMSTEEEPPLHFRAAEHVTHTNPSHRRAPLLAHGTEGGAWKGGRKDRE